MKVLVTGGAGFIGRRVVGLLREHGHRVVVLDRVSGGDLLDEGAVARAVERVDAVSHQAAKVGLGVDFDDIVDYVRDTDLGTAMVLRALFRVGFDGRLVLASSMVVYGEGSYRCPHHGAVRPGVRSPAALAAGRFEPPCPACGEPLVPEPVREDAPCDPRSVYAATKLHQEHLVDAWAAATGASTALLRYHNVYGPGLARDTPYAGVAALFRSAVLAGRRPRVFENGGQLRDFVHVDDVARANVLALSATATGPFNICSGRRTSVLDVANAISSGTPLEPVVTGEWRIGDVRHVFADPTRARRELGFEAAIPFHEGFRSGGTLTTSSGTAVPKS